MRTISKKRKWLLGTAVAGLLAGSGVAGIWLFTDCDICEAANQIILVGTVAQNCTLNVTPSAGASNLPLTTTGAQHIQVGTVLQSCNKKAGYTITIDSANCATAPTGAKVSDSVSGENLSYSAEFQNPTTGGSAADVPGLLATSCTGPIARDVNNAKISSESSTVFVNFTGSSSLAAGTYQDTLTISMNVR